MPAQGSYVAGLGLALTSAAVGASAGLAPHGSRVLDGARSRACDPVARLTLV